MQPMFPDGDRKSEIRIVGVCFDDAVVEPCVDVGTELVVEVPVAVRVVVIIPVGFVVAPKFTPVAEEAPVAAVRVTTTVRVLPPQPATASASTPAIAALDTENSLSRAAPWGSVIS
jgi:hypothetical protein